jgi:hypothetical protein
MAYIVFGSNTFIGRYVYVLDAGTGHFTAFQVFISCPNYPFPFFESDLEIAFRSLHPMVLAR